MFVCTSETLGKTLSPWGEEVVRILEERKLKHCDLLKELDRRGHSLHKAVFSQLLKGIGVRGRMDIIHEINLILGIPEAAGRPA